MDSFGNCLLTVFAWLTTNTVHPLPVFQSKIIKSSPIDGEMIAAIFNRILCCITDKVSWWDTLDLST